MTVKPRTNLILDGITLAIFLLVIVSGLLLWLVFPSGGARAGWRDSGLVDQSTILGLNKAAFTDLHIYAGLMMGVLALIHLIFHWKWITCQVSKLVRHSHGHRPGGATES